MIPFEKFLAKPAANDTGPEHDDLEMARSSRVSFAGERQERDHQTAQTG